MGSLNASKKQTLLDGETKNALAKAENKGKEKKNIDFNPKEKQNPSKRASSSNMDKPKKFDKAKWSYSKRRFYPENECIKMTIDDMSNIIEENNIYLPS